ncbi:membrane protein [Paenibacillus darwinianus]|uniref:Protein HflK n=1 Tax=Paenibacillus darwinianus TaxID=1380763 RepID=A0A9W5S3Q4_9BACL|nr:FtsH protease activity modulator HflK [Paenibacillus darwinianus]EXX91236.1 membrane protein [Paenibacillus darwinianus]EXX91857.1 membrane protein [Paenibacillus darwinianus]EXX92386.1 membrane protein [Paenibacillus darwinianus]
MDVYQGGKTGNTHRVPQLPKNLWRNAVIGAAVLIAVWIGSTVFYTVQEQEQAAILTFGKYTATQESSGLHFKLPYPVQRVVKVPANLTQKIQIGYREDDRGQVTPVEEEALMITGDENIVSADAVVEWKISNVRDYLYNIEDPELFMRNSASAAIRSVMGSTKLDFAITEGKTVIQTEVKTKLEEIQTRYQTGIQIIDLKFQDIEPPEGQVQQAFKEVTNAREEKNTKINQAQKYVNDRLPKARGEAQALIENAEAEKKSRILNAEGDVAKFNAVYNEYVKNPAVTADRLILETLERVLPNAKLIVTDGSGDTVNYLPLDSFLRNPAGAKAGASGQPGAEGGATR